MESALPLITLTEGGFCVNEETAALISQIEEPLAVICIAGMYRTGKSFLLNQLLGKIQDGFEIGPSVQPCTKGLWVWGAPISLTNEHGSFRLLLVDTEGLGSFKAKETYDHQIFSLGLLLSSLFIYNSMGTIDDNAISRLSIVAELSRHVRTRARKSTSESHASEMRELSHFFPSFVWLVRDFTLELTSEKGEKITPNDYLELVLQSSEATDATKRSVKQILREYFKERECFTLIRPVFDEKKLAHVTQADLRDDFLTQIKTFQSKLFKAVKPKQIQGDVLNGRRFMSLCHHYSKAMNEGGIVIESCWDNIVQTECESALHKASKLYQHSIEQLISEKGIIETEILDALHREKSERAMRIFDEASIGEERRQQYRKQLKAFILDHYSKTKEVLKDTSQKLCTRIISESLAEFDERFKDIEHFSQFEKRFNAVLSTYSGKAKGSERNNVLLHALLRHYFPKAKMLNEQIISQKDEAHKREIRQLTENHEREFSKLNKQREEEKQTLSEQNRKLSTARDKYKDQCHEYSVTVQKLRTTLATHEKEIAVYRQKHLDYTEESQRQSLQIETLQTQNTRLSQQNEEMKKQFFELKEQKTLVDEQLHSQRMENDSLQVEFNNAQRALERFEEKYNNNQTLLAQANTNIQHLEQTNKSTKEQLQNLEDTLGQTTELLESMKSERNELSQQIQKSEDTIITLQSTIHDLQSQLRMVQREVTNKVTMIGAYERAINLEKEKAAESEDRLRTCLKEKAHLLSSDRAQDLEKQVEQLNSANRRILELNKQVMEENTFLRKQIVKLGGTVASSNIYARISSPTSSSPDRTTPNADGEAEDRAITPTTTLQAEEVAYQSPQNGSSRKVHSTPSSPRQGKPSGRRASSSLVLSGRSVTPTPSRPVPDTPDSIPVPRTRIREADLNLSNSPLSSPFFDKSPSSPISPTKSSTIRPRPSPTDKQQSKTSGRTPSYYDFERMLASRNTGNEPQKSSRNSPDQSDHQSSSDNDINNPR